MEKFINYGVSVIRSIIPIVLFVLPYILHKTHIKSKYKKVVIKNRVTDFYYTIFNMTVLMPLITPFIYVGLVDKTNIPLVFIGILTLLTCFGTIYVYFKIIIKDTLKMQKPKIGRIDKEISFLGNYILLPIGIVAILLFNVLNLLVLYEFLDYLIQGKYLPEHVAIYVTIYIFSVFLALILKLDKKSSFTKHVKEVAVFYVQNGKVMCDVNIKFEDLNINKDIVSYYSAKKGVSVVFQTKDLLRLEYSYN